MDKEFLEELLVLCEKFGDVQFGYSKHDDGCTITVNDKEVIDKLWGADDVRKKLKELEG